MREVLIIMVAVFAISGCQQYSDNIHDTTTQGSGAYKKICIDNVYYLHGTKRLAVYIDSETLKPINCK